MKRLPHLAILIPVLGRPDRVKPLVESIRATTVEPHIEFICSPSDTAQIKAVQDEGLPALIVGWESGDGDYARKLNMAIGYVAYAFPQPVWMLLGADDLVFHPGWYEAALETHGQTGAPVVGTNDLGNGAVTSGNHATHPLVHRDYRQHGTIDDVSRLLHEGYSHNFVDNEFIETAKSRRMFASAHDSVVEHLHPIWGKGKDDATYTKGQAKFAEDRALFERRKQLWQ